MIRLAFCFASFEWKMVSLIYAQKCVVKVSQKWIRARIIHYVRCYIHLMPSIQPYCIWKWKRFFVTLIFPSSHFSAAFSLAYTKAEIWLNLSQYKSDAVQKHFKLKHWHQHYSFDRCVWNANGMSISYFCSEIVANELYSYFVCKCCMLSLSQTK